MHPKNASLRTWLAGLATVTLAALSPNQNILARGNDGPLTAGTYQDWNGVDQLTVLRAFKVADYHLLVVAPLDERGVEMPDDNTLAPTREALATATEHLVQGIRDGLPRHSYLEVVAGTGAPKEGGAGALILRARLTKLNPGSFAARFWAGFGAGAAEAAISGDVLDGRTGQPLCRFVQERRSGVGPARNNYIRLMNRSLEAIGDDVASILAAAR